MTLSHKSILNILEQVHEPYNKNFILNESDLQANLYHAFQLKFPSKNRSFQIYTERKYYAENRNFIVDCVIEDGKENISALFELKCDTYGYCKRATSNTEGFELKTQISWSDLYWDYIKMHELFSVLEPNMFTNSAMIGYIIGFTDSRHAEFIFNKLISQINSYHESTRLKPNEKLIVYVYCKFDSPLSLKSKIFSYS